MQRTIAILAMLVVSAVAPATALAGATDQQAYAGSHVTFDTESSAVVDYTVDGERTAESVRVQSQSEVESNVSLGASGGLAAVSGMAGSAVSVDARTAASTSLTTESGATIEAHDNGYGSLVVTADDSDQYVALNVSAAGDTEQKSDQRVVYETDDGATATAMVVGEGEVSVTDSGNLTASVDEDSRLVVRSYTAARSDVEAAEERLIVDETAAASVYLLQQGNATVTDTVTYGGETSVTVTERTEGQVNMTVSRTAHEGRVVITHVSNETVETASDLQVSVDAEAAASASSYAELRQAADGGSTSKYMVEGSSSASATTDARVLVGVNHFSTRQVTLTDSATANGSSDAGSTADTPSDDSADDGDSDDDSAGDADGNSDSADDDSAGDDGSDDDSADGDDGDSDSTDGDDSSSGTGSGFGVGIGLLGSIAAGGFAIARVN